MDSDEFQARANAIVAAHPPLPYDIHQEEIELFAREYAAHELGLIPHPAAQQRATTLTQWVTTQRRVAAKRILADDVKKELIYAGDERADRGPRGVRLTHIPTGHTAECTSESSGLRNHVKALTELQDLVSTGAASPDYTGEPR